MTIQVMDGIVHYLSLLTDRPGLAMIICAALTLALLIWSVRYSRKNLPPGPRPWPFIGNAILFQKDPEGYLKYTQLANKYGDIYKLRCGFTTIVMINGYDAIHEAFTKQADVFSDRPQLFVSLLGVSKGAGITYNRGHKWKTLRRFTLQSLRDFGVGKLTLEERIGEEISVLLEFLNKSLIEEGIRMKPYFLSAATNIICSIIFGTRFDYMDTRFTELTAVLEEIFRLNAPFARENFFPVTRWFSSGRELIRRRTAAIERVKSYLAETIKDHEETFDDNNIRDFIDLYIKAKRDSFNPEIITESNMYKVIVDLFLAGGETTGTSLDWAMLYMVCYPNVQATCQREIDKVVGCSRHVRLSDRGNLDYVEATLLEVLRIANTLPLSLPHICNKDTKLCGYDITKDAIVIANLYSAHMDPKYWPEPEKFRPKRFIDENGKLTRKDGLIPFGDGPRICIGEPLAKMELFLFFTNLIQRFTFTMVGPRTRMSMRGIQTLTLTPLPYKIKVVRRF